MIVLPDEILQVKSKAVGQYPLCARCLDDGDTFAVIGPSHPEGGAMGTLLVTSDPMVNRPSEFGNTNDRFRIVSNLRVSNAHPVVISDLPSRVLLAFVRHAAGWRQDEIMVSRITGSADPRVRCILETDVLTGRRVVVIGTGSIGGTVAVELGKCGVGHMKLLDYQRVEPGNISRHVCDRRDLGRRKTAAVAEAYLARNPLAEVRTYNQKIGPEHLNFLREVIEGADLVVCAVDDRCAREIVNVACLREKKTAVFASAFRRAYGGQVLRVRPGQGPCYICFAVQLLGPAKDVEISSETLSELAAYADRPVAIEPGLHNDITPICTMCVKLALQVLLNGVTTTLRSLDDDLTSDWYLFLNRRENETPYATLQPLANGVDGMRILRWYGAQLKRYDGCPACGDLLVGFGSDYGFCATQVGIDSQCTSGTSTGSIRLV